MISNILNGTIILVLNVAKGFFSALILSECLSKFSMNRPFYNCITINLRFKKKHIFKHESIYVIEKIP